MDKSVPEHRDASKRAKVESGKHSIYSHFRKDLNYEICKRKKITRALCRKRTDTAVHRAEKFGDLIAANHNILSEGCESRHNHRYSVVVQDLTTVDTLIRHAKRKLLRKRNRAFKSSWSRRGNQKSFTLTSIDIVKIFPGILVRQHRTETNGITERAVRRVKEGTFAVFLPSGLDKEWWADSMQCYCYLRNIQDLLLDGKTPYERRFGEPCKEPIVPFGAMVDHLHTSAKDMSRLHQFGPKVVSGKFLGYALHAGWTLEKRHLGRRH